MSVDVHTLRTTLWHGTRYLLDGDGITDGRLTHHTPENVHLTAARLIANAQTQPQHWTPRRTEAA